jgi:excinuclease UvrABC nuclease subunit
MNSIEEINKAPSGPGIYFLFSKRKKLVYVGKSINLRSRLSSHKNNFLEFIRYLTNKEGFGFDFYRLRFVKPFKYFRYSIISDNLDRIELQYISEIRPRFNFCIVPKFLIQI